MLAGSKVHLTEGGCLLRGHQTVDCPLPFRKIVQMCGLLGSAAPKVDFIVIHGLNPVHLKPRWRPVRECA